MDRKKQVIFFGIFGATFISSFGESLPQSFAPLFLASLGIWGMMMSLGGTVGMFVMSYIVSVAPIEWVFYFCAAFSLVAALLLSSLKGFFKA
jgi:hypothetical protein